MNSQKSPSVSPQEKVTSVECGNGKQMSRDEFPLISIGVSTYNRKDYLAKSLDSLLAQTYPNCQIVVVDDGSTDGTAEMMREKYPQIKYVYQSNAGDNAAKNHAAQIAAGEYIVFNDSDDLFMPDAIEKLYNILPENDPRAISYGNYQTIDANGNLLPTKRKVATYPSGNITGDLLRHILVNNCATLIPRQSYLEYSQNHALAQVAYDYAMSLNLSLTHKFYAVQEPIFFRRRHGNNLSSASYRKLLITFQAFSDFVDAHPELNGQYGDIIRRRKVDFHNKLYREARRESLSREALAHIRSALRIKFTFKSLWRFLIAWIGGGQ